MSVKDVFLLFQKAVTVKEALTTKGRHLRRSISTPNVQHVMNALLTALPTEPYGFLVIRCADNMTSLALQSSCSKTDLTGCEDEDCKVSQVHLNMFITKMLQIK